MWLLYLYLLITINSIFAVLDFYLIRKAQFKSYICKLFLTNTLTRGCEPGHNSKEKEKKKKRKRIKKEEKEKKRKGKEREKKTRKRKEKEKKGKGNERKRKRKEK